MTDKYYETVLLPIKVAEGGYCWEQGRRICDHFDNEGGFPECTLRIGQPVETELYHYRKPPECLRLKPADD